MPKWGPCITNAEGIMLPVRIELFETSGPVSPAFQYRLHILVYVHENRCWLDYSDDRDYRHAKPQHSIHTHTQLEPVELGHVVDELYQLDCIRNGVSIDFSKDFRNRVGISFNVLSVTIGSELDIRFDYVLSNYDDQTFACCRTAIELLKSLRSHVT